MSQIVWSTALLPENLQVRDIEYDLFDPVLKIPQALPIEAKESEFDIPDRKALRLMSRSSVLLSAALLRGQDIISQYLQSDPFRVAIYCAIENGSDNYEGVKKLLDTAFTDEDFAQKYRRSRSPKSYLKQLPNLAPAQAGIFLGLVGPLNVFQNAKWGGLHALEQMEADFANDIVDVALVCTANSFEDPLLTLKNSMAREDSAILVEGAGALLITSDGPAQEWKAILSKENSEYDFGISTKIMNLISKKEMRDE